MHSKNKLQDYQRLKNQFDKMQDELRTIQPQIVNLHEKIQPEPLKVEITEKEKPREKVLTRI